MTARAALIEKLSVTMDPENARAMVAAACAEAAQVPLLDRVEAQLQAGRFTMLRDAMGPAATPRYRLVLETLTPLVRALGGE